MIKSELVQRIVARNPHLFQREAENIVKAILGEIIAALTRGDRVGCADSARFPSSIVRPVPGAIREPVSRSRSPKCQSRTSEPAKKCTCALIARRREELYERRSRSK
jgi:hypothetical protein